MNDFSSFFQILKLFQENDAKSLHIALDECFSFDDLKGPRNQTILHFFAKDSKEYDYTLLFKSFIYLDHLDDDENYPIFYSENSVFFEKILSMGSNFLRKNKKGINSIQNIFKRDRDDLLLIFSKYYISWITNNMKDLILYSINYGSFNCLTKLFKIDQITFTNNFMESTEFINKIITTGNISFLNFLLDSLPIPFTHFHFNPCPCPAIINTILSHFTAKELFDSNKKEREQQEKSKELNNVDPIFHHFPFLLKIPDQKFKTYLIEAFKSIDQWNNSNTCIIPSPLHVIAKKNLASDLKKLTFVNVDITDSLGRTPLFVAVSNGSPETAEEFFKLGANPTINCMGSTPFHEAAKKNMVSLVSLILQTNTDINVNILNSEQCTPLMCALESDAEEVAKILLAKNSDLSVIKSNGDTIMHIAISSKVTYTILKMLIDKGAPLTIPNKKGELPFITALKTSYYHAPEIIKAMNGSFSFDVQELDSIEVWKNTYFYDLLLNDMKDFTFQNAEQILQLAVKHCHVQGFSNIFLKLTENLTDEKKLQLLKISIFADNNFTYSFLAGTFPNLLTAQSSIDHQTVLHWIAQTNPPCSDALFRATMVSIDLLAQIDIDKENPFHSAVRAKNKIFLNTFISKNPTETQKYTLNFPKEKTSVILSKALQQPNKDGFTPLELALILHYDEISLMLSDYMPHQIFSQQITLKRLQHIFLCGMSGSTFNSNRTSLLSYAIQNMNNEKELYESVKLIIDHDGDPTIADANGKKPAFYAAKKGFASVVKLLLDNGGILDDVQGFFNSLDEHVDDEILEFVHTHDMRANAIHKLYETEVDYCSKLKILNNHANEIINVSPFASNILIILKNVLLFSEKLIDFLEPVCKRLSPQSSIAECIYKLGKNSSFLHEYVCLFNKFQTEIDEKTQNQLSSKAENCDLPFGQIMELPVKRIFDYETMINTIARLTPQSHPDFEKFNLALKEWRETITKCNKEIKVFASFNTVHNQRVFFVPTARTCSYPQGSQLIWFGDITLKRFVNIDNNIKKLFQQYKDTLFIFIFDSIIWFSSSVPSKGKTVFFSIPLSNCFIDVLPDNIISFYTIEGIYEFTFKNQHIYSNFVNTLADIDKGFSFLEMKPRLIKCDFVTEERKKIETAFLMLNCDSKETAINEFHNVIKDPIKKFRGGKIEMLNVTPVGDGLEIDFC